jgi:hypothetical protein
MSMGACTTTILNPGGTIDISVFTWVENKAMVSNNKWVKIYQALIFATINARICYFITFSGWALH